MMTLTGTALLAVVTADFTFADGKLVLKKTDAQSAAFFVTFN